MKKNTRISVPRRVVLPLAAAALLGACDDRSPSTYKMTNVVPTKSGSSASDRARPSRWRDADDDEQAQASSKMKTTMHRSGVVRVHHV
jgi:hypothetical protein